MDKCTFCGAERTIGPTYYHYSCGTMMGNSDVYQSQKCKDRQILQLMDKLEAWREFKPLLEQYLFENPSEYDTEFDNLKRVGEWSEDQGVWPGEGE